MGVGVGGMGVAVTVGVDVGGMGVAVTVGGCVGVGVTVSVGVSGMGVAVGDVRFAISSIALPCAKASMSGLGTRLGWPESPHAARVRAKRTKPRAGRAICLIVRSMNKHL